MVEDFVAARLKQVREATVNKNFRTLKVIFNLVQKRGYLQSSPFAEVKQLRAPQKEIGVLSVERITGLLDACPNFHWRTFVYLALVTGTRRGELCNLR